MVLGLQPSEQFTSLRAGSMLLELNPVAINLHVPVGRDSHLSPGETFPSADMLVVEL
jgi:hypothetical protein